MHWKLCAFTCSSNVPKLPDSNASATASLDGEALEDPSRGGAAGGDSSRSGVPDATDEDVGDLGDGEDAATDSATGVAADSATEDSVAASVEGDEGAGAVEDCADESDIA